MLTQVVKITYHCDLRHCATSQKVAVSIPDSVIGNFFIDMILPGSTQPLTEERTRNISLGVKAAVA